MELHESFDDIENQLDNFIIRKNQQKDKKIDSDKSGPKIHNNIPLTISHILRVTQDPEREKVFITCDAHDNADPIYFRTCFVYGFVVGFGTHNECFNKYIIDDGTGSLDACIAKKPANREVISSLYHEASSLVSYEAYKPVAERLIRLSKIAMGYIDPSPIKRGNNLFLRGRPNIFRGKVGLDAFAFFIDSGKSRRMEIGFAKHLTHWHKNYKTQSTKNK
ncbi:uncharacterized protein LOC108030686 [Drosophila biarmipes]|uniref:uncharacterized protein LOC108030686 n=1 Tax=Drosophila biarmipes TaxID=125945 RepID=UPI0007E7ECB1|nr:uncharacterized protein LOC108030686 [Drosophila biarmipes]